MKNLGKLTSSWEPFLSNGKDLGSEEVCKVAEKIVSKKALVRKKLFEDVRKGKKTLRVQYIPFARGVQFNGPLKPEKAPDLKIDSYETWALYNINQ